MDLGIQGEDFLGKISLDTKCPILVMREYICRNNEIREKLNTQYQGNNFQYEYQPPATTAHCRQKN